MIARIDDQTYAALSAAGTRAQETLLKSAGLNSILARLQSSPAFKRILNSDLRKSLLRRNDVRNALVGSALGSLALGGASLLSDRDPEESRLEPVGDALLGAVLGGAAGYGIPRGLSLYAHNTDKVPKKTNGGTADVNTVTRTLSALDRKIRESAGKLIPGGLDPLVGNSEDSWIPLWSGGRLPLVAAATTGGARLANQVWTLLRAGSSLKSTYASNLDRMRDVLRKEIADFRRSGGPIRKIQSAENRLAATDKINYKTMHSGYRDSISRAKQEIKNIKKAPVVPSGGPRPSTDARLHAAQRRLDRLGGLKKELEGLKKELERERTKVTRGGVDPVWTSAGRASRFEEAKNLPMKIRGKANPVRWLLGSENRYKPDPTAVMPGGKTVRGKMMRNTLGGALSSAVIGALIDFALGKHVTQKTGGGGSSGTSGTYDAGK